MGATLSDALALYHEHYHSNNVEIFFTSKKLTSPILAAMETKSLDDGLGRQYVVPVVYRLPGTVRATFAASQTKARASSTGHSFGSDRWTVSALKTHAVANFDADSVLAAKGDSGKLLDIVKLSMETTTAAIRKRLAHFVSGAGWGKIGTVLATSSTTITIDPALCNRLQEGDVIAGASSESGAIFRAISSGPSTAITNIARSTGVLTVDLDPTAGTAIVVGDTLFLYDARENSATPSRQVITGLDGWFGTDTTLHGITRTGKADLTAFQVDGTSKDHSAAAVEALRTLFSYDSYASVMYVSPVDYETISLDKDAAKVISMEVGKYKIGFEGLMASWQGYSVPIACDAMVDPAKAYLGPFDDADVAPFFAHNGDLVNVADEDGMQVRAVDGSDSYEARLFNRGNIICPGPGKFARITSFGL